jgi:hypothetical protein
MILMEIVSVMREDDVRRDPAFQLFEEALDLAADVRKEAGREMFDDDVRLLRGGEEHLGASEGFGIARPRRAEYHPGHFGVVYFGQQS